MDKQESDSSIVLRDGKTDHIEKGRAGRFPGQSTHAGRRIARHLRISRSLPEQSLCDRSEEPCAGSERKRHSDIPHAGICEGAVR